MPYEDNGQSLSSETRAVVEAEVKKLVTAAHERAQSVLRAHERELHALATELLEKETLTGEDFCVPRCCLSLGLYNVCTCH